MTRYHFDKVISRRGTCSLRWDTLEEKYGDSDVIPLTTADMDFPVAPPIRKAVKRAVRQGIWGYPYPPDSYFEALLAHFKAKFGWEIHREWVTRSPGVVNAVAYCVQGMTKKGDGILIPTPMYHPFAHVIQDNERIVLSSSMKEINRKYCLDFDDLTRKLSTKNTKMMILCNPHNPIGRVWSREELKKVCELCVRFDVILVSDEIHRAFVFSGNQFISISQIAAELGRSAMEHIVVCYSASKTFNLAGLQASDIIIPGETLRNMYNDILKKQHFMSINLFAMVATEVAYRYCNDWLTELVKYLEANRDFSVDYLRKKIPEIIPVVPEATYMIWLDCRKLALSEKDLEDFFVQKAKVAVSMGAAFGGEGIGFVRLNFATPRSILATALRRIEKAVRNRV